MRILVTGARGFVGERLQQRLGREGADVIATDREVDVTDAERVARCVADSRPDAIVHLAALSSVAHSQVAPGLAYRVNFLGSRAILEAARRFAAGARVLIVSTSDVYGRGRPGQPPVTEAAPLRPESPYAAAKAAADLLAGTRAAQGLNVLRVRPFSHTGPGQRDEFVASSFARQIAEIEAGHARPKLIVGNLQSARDLLDVDDVVDAYWRLLDRAVPAGVYNIATGGAVTVRELLDRLLSHTHVRPAVEVAADRYRPTDSMRGSAQKLREATGWEPRTPLSDTLLRLLEHWRGSLDPR